MLFRSTRWLLAALFIVALPFSSPAPLIYRPGEGWTYEPVGSEGKWRRARAKEQLDVAQEAFDRQDYGLSLKAARRVVKEWPLSDYAPQAQYLVARSYEAKGRLERAFKEYNKIVTKNPKLPNFDEIVRRQYDIAGQYLAGRWFRLWGFIPLYPSMDRTAEMYDKIVKSGPFSEVAPQAQMNIGAAREKQKDYPAAAKAYELAADRYHDRPEVAADALYKQAQAFQKQSKKAEYDQTTAGQSMAVYTDFMTLYPDDPRSSEAQQVITELKTEQARGYFQTAKFYEKYHRWEGARIYYNAAVFQDPNSSYATQAKERIDVLNKRIQAAKPEAK